MSLKQCSKFFFQHLSLPALSASFVYSGLFAKEGNSCELIGIILHLRGLVLFWLANKKISFAKSKSGAEKAIISLTKNTKMDYVIIRPPIIYGEGSRSNFTKLIDLIKALPILPFSKLHNRRSFVSIYNLVDLIKKCLISDKSSNKSFLVSDNHDLSTLELARMIAKIIKKNIVFLPIPASILKIMFTLIGKGKISEKIIESLESDISYTMSELDWKPSLSVMEGLKKTLKT